MTTHFTKFETNEKKEPKLFFASQLFLNQLCTELDKAIRQENGQQKFFQRKKWPKNGQKYFKTRFLE